MLFSWVFCLSVSLELWRERVLFTFANSPPLRWQLIHKPKCKYKDLQIQMFLWVHTKRDVKKKNIQIQMQIQLCSCTNNERSKIYLEFGSVFHGKGEYAQ